MYLRKLLGKSNIYSALNKTSKRGFSFFKDFNANTLAFRASKYDPSKELEVIKIIYYKTKKYISRW